MKLFINNKKNQKICVEVDGLENVGNKKLVFLVHGLSGYKEQSMVVMPSKAFVANGYVSVRFDTRFTLGESYGEHEQASLTHSLEDLETVIDWASKQDFYAEPFSLSGHSLGGGTVIKYAEQNPELVEFLIPVSSTFGGKLLVDTWRKSPPRKKLLEELETKRKALRSRKNENGEVLEGYVTYYFIEDLLKYDMIKDAKKLNMPVLLVVGDKDPSSNIYNNQKMFEAIKGDVTLEIIANAGHVFDDDKSQRDLYKAIYNWIEQRLR